MMLKLILTLFVCLGSYYGSSASDKSSLSLIYDDLSIIARITNAIALSAGSIQKDLTASDVITELLETHSESFEQLIEYNPKKLQEELQSVFNSASQVFTNPQDKAQSLKMIKGINNFLGGAFSKKLPENITDVLGKFREESFKINSTICDIKIINIIRDFYLVMSDRSTDFADVHTQEFQGNLNNVKKCLESIKNFETIGATTKNVTIQIESLIYFKGSLNYSNKMIDGIKKIR